MRFHKLINKMKRMILFYLTNNCYTLNYIYIYIYIYTYICEDKDMYLTNQNIVNTNFFYFS